MPSKLTLGSVVDWVSYVHGNCPITHSCVFCLHRTQWPTQGFHHMSVKLFHFTGLSALSSTAQSGNNESTIGQWHSIMLSLPVSSQLIVSRNSVITYMIQITRHYSVYNVTSYLPHYYNLWDVITFPRLRYLLLAPTYWIHISISRLFYIMMRVTKYVFIFLLLYMQVRQWKGNS